MLHFSSELKLHGAKRNVSDLGTEKEVYMSIGKMRAVLLRGCI